MSSITLDELLGGGGGGVVDEEELDDEDGGDVEDESSDEELGGEDELEEVELDEEILGKQSRATSHSPKTCTLALIASSTSATSFPLSS